MKISSLRPPSSQRTDAKDAETRVSIRWQYMATTTGRYNSLTRIAGSPDGEYLAGVTCNGYILLWKSTAEHPVAMARQVFAASSVLAFTAESRKLLSGEFD